MKTKLLKKESIELVVEDSVDDSVDVERETNKTLKCQEKEHLFSNETEYLEAIKCENIQLFHIENKKHTYEKNNKIIVLLFLP